MLTCQGLSDKATEYMEGALPRAQRLSVWAHLRVCPACRRYLRQLRLAIGLARSATMAPPPDATEEKLVAMFRAERGGRAE
jgi:predicted anti-sigma-YlaC factor YlaD